jgi:Uma2 family endonuclease
VNPKGLIEVLSPSTEHHDRQFKFKHYRRLDSVTEIVLVHQDSPSVECYFRQPGTDLWIFDPRYGLEEAVHLKSIGCTLTLAQIYQDLEFPPEEETSEAEIQ